MLITLLAIMGITFTLLTFVTILFFAVDIIIDKYGEISRRAN